MMFDFPEDALKVCGGDGDDAAVTSTATGGGPGRPLWRRHAMFAALWTGAGLMAFIGRYL